jgi:hypothetical protein
MDTLSIFKAGRRPFSSDSRQPCGGASARLRTRACKSNSTPDRRLSLYIILSIVAPAESTGVPPQPFRFFESIGRHVFGPGQGFVAVARLASKPIAAAVFFHHGHQAFYKFGASDYRLQHLRPNNLLMWEAMKRFAAEGFEFVHLGRTSLSNEGLRRFKLGLGAAEETIRYAKFDLKRKAFVRDIDRSEQPIKRLFGYLPSSLFRLVGRLLYPHLS